MDQKASKVTTKVKMAGKSDTKTYSFDNVFGPESSQMDVYDGTASTLAHRERFQAMHLISSRNSLLLALAVPTVVVSPLLEEVLNGFSCTVFA